MKKIIAAALIITFFIIKVLPFFLPIRFAVSENELNKSDNYIICRRGDCYCIGTEWNVLRSNDEIYKSGTYMIVEGISNPGNIYGAYGFENENQFVFYGEPDKTAEDKAVFNANKWDVLYPVKHQEFLGGLISKKYLCLYDTEYTFKRQMKLFNKVFIWNYKSFSKEPSA